MNAEGRLYGVADGAVWTAPELAVDVAAFPDSLAAGGFLTPTPVLHDSKTVRVFGGMRDAAGVARVGWVDIDIATRRLVDVCDRPCLGVGEPGAFDANGVILGDVVTDPVTGDLLMAYVGFSMFPTVKFRAFSGLAKSCDGGRTFERVTREPWLGAESCGSPTSIVAVHALRRLKDSTWTALVAVGDGWESIDGLQYPRYFTVSASGYDLATLSIARESLLPIPDGVYRLGRPRFVPNGPGDPAIVATGGRRDGDYRAYVFARAAGRWVQSKAVPPVVPGCSPLAQIQAAYPAHIVADSEVWVFFNGDAMGRAGALLTRAPCA